MIYLSGVHSDIIAEYAQTHQWLGLMAQPASATIQHVHKYNSHAFDNGAFGAFLKGKPFAVAPWRRQLQKLAEGQQPGLLFAVVPDVVGDHKKTLTAWDEHVGYVLEHGLPPAFVLQNGCHDLSQVPLAAQAVFIGGDDAYKLGPEAARVCWQAHRAGIWVHMGRVNSGIRIRRAVAMGCDSADGTFLRFGPHAYQLARLQVWLDEAKNSGGQLDLRDHAGAA